MSEAGPSRPSPPSTSATPPPEPIPSKSATPSNGQSPDDPPPMYSDAVSGESDDTAGLLGNVDGNGKDRNRGLSLDDEGPSVENAMLRTSEEQDEDNIDEVPDLDIGGDNKQLATVEQKKALWWKNVFITGLFICSWYGFATLLSLYNKWMFTPQYYNFPYPLFVTTCHFTIQFFLSAIIVNVWPQKFKPLERPTRKEYVSKIFPAATSTGGDIGLSNMSLKVITLSLYTMVKSSTLLFVLLFAFIFRIETPSLRLVGVILLISFGVFLMVFNTTAVSISGLIMVFSASGLAGLRWALTEMVMKKKAIGLSNPFATIFWLAPLMALSLAVVSLGLEGWGNVFNSEHLQGSKAILTTLVIIFPGGLAFAMVSSEYFIIHRAGSVPLSIAGIFKEVTTISISALVFGDELTELNIIGVAITVMGIALFTFHKYQKSISTPVPLDSNGSPHPEDVDPNTPRHMYHSVRGDERRHLSHSSGNHDRVQLETLSDESITGRGSRVNEGDEWSDADGNEVEEEEVARLREEREAVKVQATTTSGGWGKWWDKKM